MFNVIVTENLLLGTRVDDSLDHRGMVAMRKKEINKNK